MFKQLLQAQSISIIGGADGPTSIYVSPAYLWQIIVILICVIALIVFGICGLIKNIKKNNKVKIILWSFVLFILILLVFIIPAWNFIETRKKMKMLEADVFTTRKEIYGSEVPGIAEDSFTGTVGKNIFRFDNDIDYSNMN